jgi:aspartate kinase
MKKTLVMKFGGAAVATPQHFAHIADIVADRLRHFSRIAIVVSAMGDTTNQLISLAKQVHPNPPTREYDMLVSVGERISISLLAMALSLKNIEAVSYTGSQSGIITCDRHSEARIVEVRPKRLIQSLDEGKVVITAGFQGVSLKGEITTLGRGGSDTTAVALGVALEAQQVEFFKDVPGIFTHDPKKDRSASMHQHLNYSQALDIVNKGAKVLHPRSIELASKNALPLHVLSFESSQEQGTWIGEATSLRPNTPKYEEIC